MVDDPRARDAEGASLTATVEERTAVAARQAEDAALSAPQDPRGSWMLPAFGAMPLIETLDEQVVRVLAPNPSPMTLDGTNTYVIGTRACGVALVVDPGPRDDQHLEQVRRVLQHRDAEAVAIVVTHHHPDHAEAAQAWSARWGCPVVASTRAVAGQDGMVVGDAATVGPREARVEVVATPGHTADHLALRLPTGALLTGDHVLGRGTSVVAHPDGDLEAYLDSLRRIMAIGPDRIYPGHGPALTEDPGAVLRYYLEHRGFRERQLLRQLATGPATPAALVAAVYVDVDTRLWPAAEASTRAALAALAARDVVRHGADDVVHLVGADSAAGVRLGPS